MKKRRACRPLTWDLLEDRLVPSPGGVSVATGSVQPADLSILGTEPYSTPTQRTDPEAFQAHAAAVAMADSGRASGVVFFGDSIIARWDEPGFPGLPSWNAEIAPFGAADFGVDGDQTQNLIWRLENGELDGTPRVAVVQIGTNNLFNSDQNEAPQETADGIDAVVQTIRTVSPNTKILLLGVLPRFVSPSDPIRAEIRQINNRISGLADGTNVDFLDLGSLFLRQDGTIPSELMLTPDFTHPNTDGYQLMADAVQAPIDALLGRPAPDRTSYGGPILVDMPGDQTAEEADPRGALLSFALPLAFDALDPAPVVTISPPRGTILLETTVVTCTATDRYGHITSASFDVTVEPEMPPVLQDIPPDQVVEATSPLGAVVRFALPMGTDASDPNVRVICVPASGSTFPLGTTTVICTATDQVGNVARASFTIDVRDTTPPAIVAPDLVVEAIGPSGASVSYSQVRVTELVDPAPFVQFSIPSGAAFPIGVTPVTCTTMDRTGNVSSATFLVTVVDTPVVHNPPPSLVVYATGPAGAVVRFTPPTATDVADPNIQVVDSRASSSRFPIGTTVVTCTATGISGVSTTVTFTVTVVTRRVMGSVSNLAQAALGRIALELGDDPAPASSRSGRRTLTVSYGPSSRSQGAAVPATNSVLVAFLSQVDTNHDFLVSLQELQAYISVNVDLNHDGKVSLYEEALLQLHNPAVAALLFPGA